MHQCMVSRGVFADCAGLLGRWDRVHANFSYDSPLHCSPPFDPRVLLIVLLTSPLVQCRDEIQHTPAPALTAASVADSVLTRPRAAHQRLLVNALDQSAGSPPIVPAAVLVAWAPWVRAGDIGAPRFDHHAHTWASWTHTAHGIPAASGGLRAGHCTIWWCSICGQGRG